MQIRRESLFSSVVSFLIGACLSAQTLTEFVLPEGARPQSIIVGPDGNLWFTDAGPGEHSFLEPNQSRIGRITTSGEITFFPGNARPFHYPSDLAAGPDGNVWVIHLEGVGGDGAINRVTPAGEVRELLWTGAHRITAGPDGNLWFTDLFRDIGRITPVGQVTYFPAPQTEFTSDITTGPDGNLWFTYFRLARVGRMTPAGVVTEFDVPALPYRITSGPDGNLWFTEANANRIGRITPEGVVTEFPVPMRGVDIAAGPDGDLWFTQPAASIGRITTTGLVTEIPIPAPASGITAGPDGNIWFTEAGAGKIGRIALTHQPAIESRILPVVGSTGGAGGSFFRTAVQMHNPTNEQMTGRLVFHPSGDSGASSDPALFYSLLPGQTQSIADLLPAMGRSGLGSADIEVTAGHVPTVTVRVFNDAGAAGTTGFTEEPMRVDDALRPEVSGALLVPADPTRFRFNLGVRTLEATTATLTVRDASGAVTVTVSRVLPTTYHEQQSASAFLGFDTLPAGGSIAISVTSGSAVFYGATVDNTTGDPSFQIARGTPD